MSTAVSTTSNGFKRLSETTKLFFTVDSDKSTQVSRGDHINLHKHGILFQTDREVKAGQWLDIRLVSSKPEVTLMNARVEVIESDYLEMEEKYQIASTMVNINDVRAEELALSD